MRLLMYSLMVFAGLLGLFTPLRHLGLRGRPWPMILIMLPIGFFGALGPLAQGFGLSLWWEVMGLAGQVVAVLLLISAFFWLRARANRQGITRQAPVLSGRDVYSDAKALLAAGRKIEAIRLVRERTGLGLAEAKRAVESLS